MKKILVTGGAGFIGSHFVKHLLKKYPAYHVTVLDKLTYAGNLENLNEVSRDPRYRFVKGDVQDQALLKTLSVEIDGLVHFAAATHVDRSIQGSQEFVDTNVKGTLALLEAARAAGIERFVHISTDEVYGSVARGSATEESHFAPNNPYSASKAAGDLMARSYFITYGLPIMLVRPSNNYGPNQYPEKALPLFITNLIENKKIPLYGDGKNVRDWLFVEDTCRAVDLILHKGKPGEIYNVAGGNEKPNRDVVSKLLALMKRSRDWIQPVKDRPGHDRRYSMTDKKIRRLGWKPLVSFEEGLKRTVAWYHDNPSWWQRIKHGEGYRSYYAKQYGERAAK